MDKKQLQKYLNKNKSNDNSKFKKVLSKLMICLILFLSLAILCKSNDMVYDFVKKNLFDTNFSFAKIKNVYNKYLGGIFPLDDTAVNVESVFNEKLTYSNEEKYNDGVKLTVTNNYLVPAVKSGLVVFIGEKEEYGNVIIVQGEDGIDLWYGNMLTTAINLYDYIEIGTLLGEVKDNYLYLVYSQNGKYLEYEKFFS